MWDIAFQRHRLIPRLVLVSHRPDLHHRSHRESRTDCTRGLMDRATVHRPASSTRLSGNPASRSLACIRSRVAHFDPVSPPCPGFPLPARHLTQLDGRGDRGVFHGPGQLVYGPRRTTWTQFVTLWEHPRIRLSRTLRADVQRCNLHGRNRFFIRLVVHGTKIRPVTPPRKSGPTQSPPRVLTEPGLAGIVAAVKEGRTTFQRILSYTLNSITKKTVPSSRSKDASAHGRAP
jgi:hypothetical protein